jgi:hypothetical protein
MSYSKSVCVLVGAVGDFGEGGDTSVARELENMGGILDDCFLLALHVKCYSKLLAIDVNVPALQRINSSASIDRVLVLIYLDNVVELIRPILIST